MDMNNGVCFHRCKLGRFHLYLSHQFNLRFNSNRINYTILTTLYKNMHNSITNIKINHMYNMSCRRINAIKKGAFEIAATQTTLFEKQRGDKKNYLLPPRLTLGNSTGSFNLTIRLEAASALPPFTPHLANSLSRGLSTRQPSSRKYCRVVALSSLRSSRRSEGSVASSFGEFPPPPSAFGCGGM